MNNSFASVLKKLFFFILLVALTPVIVVEQIVALIKKSVRQKKWKEKELEGQKLIIASSITDIDIMEGYMFEDYLRILLFYMGYKVSVTQKSRDYGADLVIIEPKTNIKIIIQAKRYSKPVGSKAVQEILTAMPHYKADEAWVITNNVYTPQAEELAKENNIRLIDRQELIEMYTAVCKQFEIDNADGKLLYEKTPLKDKFPFYI